jgi:hypothetical protein
MPIDSIGVSFPNISIREILRNRGRRPERWSAPSAEIRTSKFAGI